ncbi:hypothetical protein DYY66_1988 [Candidatus Nitrosotalea sp. FS]|nr:hypothetical protein [Candidatus Nitrosotalea sp. FS]
MILFFDKNLLDPSDISILMNMDEIKRSVRLVPTIYKSKQQN